MARNLTMCSATECAEIEAGAGLVGADLGAGAGGAAEAGGLEPDVDMQGGVGGAPLFGQLEGALGAVGTHGAGVEFGRLCIRQVGGHVEAVVGNGIHVAKSGIGAGDVQEVALYFGSYDGRDMARPLGQQQPFGAEVPGGCLLIPAQSPILPVGFDEGIAGCLFLCLFSDTGEAEVDGLGQLRRETVDEGQLVAVFLLRRRAWVGGTVGVFFDLLAVEHYIYLVAPTAVLQSRGIYL